MHTQQTCISPNKQQRIYIVAGRPHLQIVLDETGEGVVEMACWLCGRLVGAAARGGGLIDGWWLALTTSAVATCSEKQSLVTGIRTVVNTGYTLPNTQKQWSKRAGYT